MNAIAKKPSRSRETTAGGGLSVTVRLALIISGAIAAFTLVFGLVIYNIVLSLMSRQIDEAGILAARSLSVPAFEVYGRLAGTTFQGREAEFPSLQVPVPPLEQASFGVVTKLNGKRLESLFDQPGALLDSVVLTLDRKSVYAGRAPITFDSRKAGTVSRGVTIIRGTYRQNNARVGVRARLYEAPIRKFDGTEGGYAVVALSEERINDRLNDVLIYIIVLAFIFLVLGAGASYFLGRRFTTPIRSLIEDVEIVAEGDLDHRTRAHSHDEIGRLAVTFDQMTRNLRASQDAERDLIAQRHQLGVAMEIQENLIPKDLPKLPGLEIEALYRAGTDGSGDFYDVLTFKDGQPGILIASSSGTGIPAAMLTAMVRSFLIATSPQFNSPADLLRHINKLLSPDLRRGLYVTSLLARVEEGGRTLTLANAGHSALVCWRASSEKIELIHSEGIALGFDKGPVFDKTMKEVRFEIQGGDRVVFCTPGLFLMKSAEGKDLGENRFYGLVSKAAPKESKSFLATVARTLQKFQSDGTEDSETDRGSAITLVTLKRQ